MTIISIQEAQARLLDLIRQLSPGEQVLLTDNDQPIAFLSRAPVPATTSKGDWWAAIQDIEKNQKLRGFVGEVSEIDRDDQAYDERMKQIYKDTIPRN